MCNFRHFMRDIKLTVHGNDFLVVADGEQLHWLNKKLKEYEIKFQVMGPEKHLSQYVKWTHVGIEYEADVKHASLNVKETETANMMKAQSSWHNSGE